MPTVRNNIFGRRKILRHIFRFRGFAESLRLAVIGMSYLFLYHRNMRIIVMAGAAAFLLGIYLKLSGLELAALCITITLVLMAEIFNTAIELIIDMRLNKYHTLVKLVKDISAAVVLIASINALAVGYALFARRLIYGGG
jgi:diacylglycerol kinase (ATP)